MTGLAYQFWTVLANPSFAKEGDGKPGREGATPVVTQLLGHEGCATSKVQPMPLHAHERNAFRVATGATDETPFVLPQAPQQGSVGHPLYLLP